ncbi:MAG: carboxypeptidase-like regulatory domain-containing protein [Planctomycetota bacterium]
MNRSLATGAAILGLLLLAGLAFWQLRSRDDLRDPDSSRTGSERQPSANDEPLPSPPGLEDGRVRGFLRDTSGELLAEVPIRAFDSDALWWRGEILPIAEASTSLDGAFSIGGLPPRTVTLIAEPVGYAPVTRQIDLRSPGSGRIGIELVTSPGPPIEGRIHDGDGEPLSGVTVWALERRGPQLAGLGLPTSTDGNGIFRFDSAPAGRIALYLRHPGKVARLVDPWTPGETAALGLEAGGSTLEIIVVDRRTSEPVPGIELTLADDAIIVPGLPPLRSTSDSLGRSRFEGLTPGQYRLVVRAGERQDGKEVLVDVGPGERTEWIDLPERAEMKAQLIDGRTGRGLPDITVRLDHEAGDFDEQTRSGQEGRLSLRLPVRSATPYEIRIASDEWILQAPEMPYGSLQVPPGEGPPDYIVPLTAFPPARLHGQVFAPDGAPVAGAEVIAVVRTPGGIFELGRAGSGEDGTFVLPPLPEHDSVQLWCQAGDWAPVQVGPVSLTSGRITGPVPVRLEPGIRLGGTVKDPAGNPVYGARILVRSARPVGGWRESETTTGPDGRFVVGGLPEATVQIGVIYGGTAPASFDGLRLNAGDPKDDLELSIGEPTRIAGRVQDEDGSPLAGYPVVLLDGDLERDRTRTATDGSFAFHGHPDRTYRVKSAPPASVFSKTISQQWLADQGDHVREVEPSDETDVTLTVVRPELGDCTLTLALDEEAALPKRASLELQPLPAGRSAALRLGLSDLGRQVRLRRLDAGKYRLTLQPAGFAPQRREIEIRPDEEVDLGTWRFEPGATVGGQIVDFEGRPVTGAAVIPLTTPRPRPGELTPTVATTGADGRFVLAGVVSDTRYLYVRAIGHATHSVPWEPGRTSVQIRLPESATLELLLPEDHPESERLVRVFEVFEEGELLVSESKFQPSNVRTRLEDLPVSTFRVELWFAGTEIKRSVTIETKPGRTVEADLRE